MSIQKEESDKKFREWKKDIERRLQEYLDKHPEEPKKAESEFKMGPKTIVEVTERKNGEWVVFRNGLLMQIFYGGDAHRRASQYANDLFNNPLGRRGSCFDI